MYGNASGDCDSFTLADREIRLCYIPVKLLQLAHRPEANIDASANER